MRQNFRRDKLKKEEMRKKKQEDKRNKRLHKKDGLSPQASEGIENPAEMSDSGTIPDQAAV